MGSFSIWHWIVLLVLLPLAFLPTIIAFARQHAQRWWILAINVLLNWTVIGWIGALIWAIVGKPQHQHPAGGEVFQ